MNPLLFLNVRKSWATFFKCLYSFVAAAKAEGDEHIAESDGHALTSVLGSLAVLASEPALCRILVPKLLHITESQWAGAILLPLLLLAEC